MRTFTKGSWHIVILAGMVLCLSSVGSMAATPSGTQIHVSGGASYSAVDGTAMPDATSNTTSVAVSYPSNLSIGEAKQLPVWEFVQLNPATVTGGTPELAGLFYIEETDRSAGILVRNGPAVQQGDLVTVTGHMDLTNGETHLDIWDVVIHSSQNELPEPLGITGPAFRSGLSNIGLLVKLRGKVTSAPAGAAYFHVDDGSGIMYGTTDSGIRVYGTPPANSIGKYVSVTGIIGGELVNNVPTRILRTRRPSDTTLLE